ncbi:MAG: hypothetical protein H0X16_02905 [Chloroflexi bacterium]|nr:hypothetical protein [Chloroflexota bacterium]
MRSPAPARTRAARAFGPGERAVHARHGGGTVTGMTHSGVSVRFDAGVVGNVVPTVMSPKGAAEPEPLDAAAEELLNP